jgi:hypothetical protein
MRIIVDIENAFVSPEDMWAIIKESIGDVCEKSEAKLVLTEIKLTLISANSEGCVISVTHADHAPAAQAYVMKVGDEIIVK